MDPETVRFYAANAADMAGRYGAVPSAAARRFDAAFAPGSRVLDVGCAAGRDVRALIEEGYQAAGVDATPELLAEAQRRHPHLPVEWIQDALPRLTRIADAAFDGVLCWAVLMHLPPDELPEAARTFRRVLRPGGRLLISTPLVGPEVDPDTHRSADRRLFSPVTPEEYQRLLEGVGFCHLERWDEHDSLDRPNRRWATQLFEAKALDRSDRLCVLAGGTTNSVPMVGDRPR
jgi:SAM-dependent methyltransferase